jgi:hypothetical protein
MDPNVFLTTAFEIECRATTLGLFDPAAHTTFGSPLSLLPTWHFVEIAGDAPLQFVTEACDA